MNASESVQAGDGAPLVSVIVPCRNEVGSIDAFIASVRRQSGLDGRYEVIVADGASDDGTRGRLEAAAAVDPRIVVIDNPEGTVSFGLNRAIRVARAPIVARMDVHTEYAEDYLATCLSVLAETGADNVGGPALTRAHGYWQQANAAAYSSPFSVGGARFHDPAYEGYVDTVTYGCWRLETLQKIGLFDEELVRNQDDECNFRLTRSGGRIWQSPRIRSWYHPRASLRQLHRQYYQYGYWKVHVLRKHRGVASGRQLVPVAALFTGLVLAIAGLQWPVAWVCLATLTLLYAVLSVVCSLRAALRAGRPSLAFGLPLVFATYHLGYGWGYARGLVDVARGVTARSSAAVLSR